MQEKKISFLGKNINYFLSGQGENLIVLLHGFLESSSMWEDYSFKWEKEYKVIAIDLPGHGKTDSLAEVNSTLLMADSVDAVLKNEKVSSAILIGHSMGGYVALSYGERYSEKIKGVVLLNSTALADSDIKKGDRDRAIKVMQKNPSIFINESIPNLFATDYREKYLEEIKLVIDGALKTNIDGACACLRGMKEREDKTFLLKENRFPIKFIAGAKDNVIPIEKVKEQISLHPKIHHQIFEESGHMSFIEEKEACFQAINSFLTIL
jgi:pimeloyl-ACP methyl ester carboxylesterase